MYFPKISKESCNREFYEHKFQHYFLNYDDSHKNILAWVLYVEGTVSQISFSFRAKFLFYEIVLNRLVQFNVIRRYVKTNSSPYYS